MLRSKLLANSTLVTLLKSGSDWIIDECHLDFYFSPVKNPKKYLSTFYHNHKASTQHSTRFFFAIAGQQSGRHSIDIPGIRVMNLPPGPGLPTARSVVTSVSYKQAVLPPRRWCSHGVFMALMVTVQPIESGSVFRTSDGAVTAFGLWWCSHGVFHDLDGLVQNRNNPWTDGAVTAVFMTRSEQGTWQLKEIDWFWF